MCLGSVGAGRPRAAQLTRVWGARAPSLCSPGRTVAAFVCMLAVDFVPGPVSRGYAVVSDIRVLEYLIGHLDYLVDCVW